MDWLVVNLAPEGFLDIKVAGLFCVLATQWLKLSTMARPSVSSDNSFVTRLTGSSTTPSSMMRADSTSRSPTERDTSDDAALWARPTAARDRDRRTRYHAGWAGRREWWRRVPEFSRS